MNTKKNYIQPESLVVKIETDIIAFSGDQVNLDLDLDEIEVEGIAE